MKLFLKRTAYVLLFVFLFFNIICAFQAYHFTRFDENAKSQDPKQMGIPDKTSAALFGVPVPKSKVVDSLTIAHNNVTLTTEDGFKLASWELQHSTTGSVSARGTIVMFHGHGSSRSGIIAEATEFYNLGWNVFMTDFRSHGESEGSECYVGYKEVRDVKAAYDHVAATGEKNIVLYGISMGAATVSKAMYDYPPIQPRKIILEMPFASMHEAVEGFVRTMKLPDEPLGTFLTFWGGTELGIWAFANKPEEYVKKISCPALLQWGRKDIRVTEKETDELFANLGSKQKKIVKYDGVAHESICKHSHEKWMQNITAFLAGDFYK